MHHPPRSPDDPAPAVIPALCQAKAYEFEQGHISTCQLSLIASDLKGFAAYNPKTGRRRADYVRPDRIS